MELRFQTECINCFPGSDFGRPKKLDSEVDEVPSPKSSDPVEAAVVNDIIQRVSEVEASCERRVSQGYQVREAILSCAGRSCLGNCQIKVIRSADIVPQSPSSSFLSTF